MLYVSICIPTKNRSNYVKETVESILNDDVDKSEYEIVISDNSDNSDTENYAKELIMMGYNIVYYKNPEKGFYNSIKVLTLANGLFLKLQNDYSKFRCGGFRRLVDVVKLEIDEQPQIFFSNGSLGKWDKKEASSLNEFIRITTFQNTWSSAFSIWKNDLSKVSHTNKSVDSMFPHTSLLLNLSKERYIIDNNVYIDNIPVEKKGGYNIFYNFCILYLGMLEGKMCEGGITKKTYNIVKYRMLLDFIAPWYYRTILTDQGYTFDNANANENIRKKYGFSGLSYVFFLGYLNSFYKKFTIFLKSRSKG
ncbi:glycosyltransferase [Pectobacterium brasiliense]|uniref:glycosyltransferase n=1 Tax=Pectobacterium brasiliense TaxID=180957 RepID=UPI001969728C|nr:glycosyltransferase [Pectobacterium brasiliense]MBN3132397.1 glycosyltransferase [Pectobacterium brasiliense]